ncbi:MULTISPECIES: hypothetical protein [Clostridium]|uniref:hypothetical protein n=1 Tax=Clostridium TaxID=1485 RepID=UPI00242EA45B|nr:hypothetical protein [Clostridium tyrobutyricum]
MKKKHKERGSGKNIMSDKIKLNKKGISYIIMYTALFVFAMSMLFFTLNKFKISTERASLFQAADSAAREVAAEIYRKSYDSLEQYGKFTVNTDDNIRIARNHLAELGVMKNGNLTVNNVKFDPAQAKVVVICTYQYKTEYLNFIKKVHYSTPLTIKGVAYLKDVEFKE